MILCDLAFCRGFFAVIVTIIIAVITFLGKEKKIELIMVRAMLSILLVFCTFALEYYIDYDRLWKPRFEDPQAIDVYKGRTNLEVTGKWINDSTFIPTDSIVVWKEEECQY